MSSKHSSEQKIDPKKAILNLTKIIPVNQSSILNFKICPFFVLKDEMKDINKNFPTQFTINNSDPLGPFIQCEYTKDGNSYRSPWSNKYFPPTESNKLIPKELRELEEKINQLMKLYLKVYYNEDALSSAYIIFQEEQISNGFNCHVYIKSKVTNSEFLKNDSFLESTNIISVKFMQERSDAPNKKKIKVIYKTNTIFLFKLELNNLENAAYNGTKFCDCMKTTYITNYFDYENHLKYIGKSIEENEGNLRLKLDKIYFEKINYICKEIRMEDGQDGQKNNQIKNLKNICSEFEKYATRRMKAESSFNEKKKINF